MIFLGMWSAAVVAGGLIYSIDRDLAVTALASAVAMSLYLLAIWLIMRAERRQ